MEDRESFRYYRKRANKGHLSDVNKNKFNDSGIDMEFEDEVEEDVHLSENMGKMTDTWMKPYQNDNEDIVITESSGPDNTNNDKYFYMYEVEDSRSAEPSDSSPDTYSYTLNKDSKSGSCSTGNETSSHKYDLESYYKMLGESKSSSCINDDKYSNEIDLGSYIREQYDKNQRQNIENDKNEKYDFSLKLHNKKIGQVPCDENNREIPDTDFRKCHERLKIEIYGYEYMDRKNKISSTNNDECSTPHVKEIEIEDRLQIAHPFRKFCGEDTFESSHTDAKKKGNKTKENKNYVTTTEEKIISMQPTISKTNESAVDENVNNGHNRQPDHDFNVTTLHVPQDKTSTSVQQKNSSANTNKPQLQSNKQFTNEIQKNNELILNENETTPQNNENVKNHFQKKNSTRNSQLNAGSEIRKRKGINGKFLPQRQYSIAKNGITGMEIKKTCLKFENFAPFSKFRIQKIHMINMYPCERGQFSNDRINQVAQEGLPDLSRILPNYNTDQNYGRDHDPTDYIHQSALRLQDYRHVSDHQPGSNQTIPIHLLHSNGHINQAYPERSMNANGMFQNRDPTDYIHLSALRRVSYHQANINRIISIHGSRTTNRSLNLDFFVDSQSRNPSLPFTDRSIARIVQQMFEMFHFHVYINGTRRCLQASIDNTESVSSLRLTRDSMDDISQLLNSDDFPLDINILGRIRYSNITTEESVTHTENGLPTRQDLTLPEQNLLHSTGLIEGLSIPVNFEIGNRLENADSRHIQTSSERLLSELSNCESTTSASTTLQNRTERQIEEINYKEMFGDAYGEVQAETESESTERASSVQNIRPNSSPVSQECCSLCFESSNGINLSDGLNQSKKPDSAEMDNCDDLGGKIAHISNDQNIKDSGYISRDQRIEEAVGVCEESEFQTTQLKTIEGEYRSADSNLVNSDIVNITYRGRILTSFVLDKNCELQEILQKINHVILEYLQEEPDLYNVQRYDHHTIIIDDDTYNIWTE